MALWLAEGRIKSREDIAEDFDTFPDVLLRLYSGENTGKLVLALADD
jgi:NADPH-dependent curcumin reductase CurA